MNNYEISRKFLNYGYSVVNFLPAKKIDEIKKILIKRIKKLNRNYKIINNINQKNMQNYHLFNFPEVQHKKMLKTSSRYIMLTKALHKTISRNKDVNLIMKSDWGHKDFIINWVGSLKKGHTKKKAIGFRISRPTTKRPKDATGVHCDLHVGGKICSDKKVLVSVWLPLVGFNKKYTLRLAPKSHLFDHPTSQFAKSKTVTNIFSSNYNKSFKFVRPSLKKGQAIIFHSNLLHGESYNEGKKTRFSLEIRYYNKKKINTWLN